VCLAPSSKKLDEVRAVSSNRCNEALSMHTRAQTKSIAAGRCSLDIRSLVLHLVSSQGYAIPPWLIVLVFGGVIVLLLLRVRPALNRAWDAPDLNHRVLPLTPFLPPSSVLYADLREKWKHEDELINRRVTWLLQTQGFLFSAFGVLAKLRIDEEIAAVNGCLAENSQQLWILYGLGEALIAFCALVVAFYLKHAIVAAIEAMAGIKKDLHRYQDLRLVWDIKVDGKDDVSFAGAAPSRVMADTFLYVWVFCLCYESYRISSSAIRLLTLLSNCA
jgi:hypothetical protein